MDCLKTLVGLSQRTCDCYGGRPENADHSLSGYYVDDEFESVPLVFAEAGLHCADTLWGVLEKARDSAVKNFYQEFIAGFRNSRIEAIDSFVGELGEGEQNGKINMLLPISSGAAGISLTPVVPFKGAQMTLRSVSLYINATGVFNVSIYRSENLATPLLTMPVPTTADKKSTYTLPVPLNLPLTDSVSGKKITYVMSYDLNGARPWNVLWNCRCSGSERPWEAFIEAKGLSGPDAFSMSQKDARHSNGMYVNLAIGCRSDSWICEATQPGLLEDDFTIVMSKAIQLMSIRNVLLYASKSGKISYWTMLVEESAPAEIKRLTKEIDWRMAYLFNNTPAWVSDCFVCKDRAINKGSIIV